MPGICAKQGNTRLASRVTEECRGSRVNSRVPVRLEWDAATGPRISVEAHTRVVNPYGCMVVLEAIFGFGTPPGSYQSRHEQQQRRRGGWKGTPRPDGWEYGIELVAPEMDFWGLEL